MNYQQFTDQGTSLIKINKLEEAKFFFEKALELRPDFADALTNLAVVEHELGNLNHAVRLYKEAVAVSPKIALKSENKILSVIYYFSQNNIQEALETLNMLVEKNPTDALLFNMLGGCLASIGQTEMAIANYQKAL